MAISQKDLRIGLVIAQFNDLVTSRLCEGARKALIKAGVEESRIEIMEVPGSFEVPLAAQWMIESRGADGIVALGAVIRGQTSHYDFVCSAASSGLMKVQLATGRPVGFGILTCETMEQALDRAGGKLGNKGAETAHAVLEMIRLKRELVEQR